MNKLVMMAAAAAISVGATACQKATPAQKQVEKQADAIGDAYKADADLQKSLAQGAPDEKIQKQQAEQLEKKGDQIEKNLKHDAKEMGKDTRKMGDAGKTQ